ncbi:transcription termination factor 4, mitochondrial [Monodelphis domestica]|uniref:transcription termination factor 4, mitochondrial n=1 Tax=Monodelphis domestica TaxID=13616 RepID=UPI0024E1ECEC|nr:transcription termination factor 4, mitochondrial [Monodelphis domestica]
MAASCRQVFRWPQLALFQAPGRLLTTASLPGAGEEAPSPGSSESPAEGGLLGQQEAEARRWLLDAGFDPTQTAQLLSARQGVRPPHVWAVVSELLLLGLSPGPVCEAVRRNPGILQLSGAQLKSRASRLRKLGLGAGNLQHVCHWCPDVFTMSSGRLDGLVSVLRDRCLFSGRQVTEILHTCPRVLLEEPEALEYKFQYAYFRMGIKQPDLVKTKYFQYSMAKIKERHGFLERLGRYQTPDKKGQTQICNPSLNSILRVPEAEFLASTARSSPEEFQIFKKLLAREEAEEGDGGSSDEDDSDLEDADSSGDEED